MVNIRSIVLRASLGIIFAGFFSGSVAGAAPFSLPQLDPSQIDGLLETVSAGLSFHPLEPASSYGKIWGLSFGIQGSAVSTSKMSSLLPSGPSFFPAADLYGGLQLPFGLAVEIGLLPSISLKGGSYSDYGGAVKWTFTDLMSNRYRGPISSAVRFIYSHASLNYDETLSGANVAVGYSSSSEGLALGMSLPLFIFEPYLDLGWITQSSTVSGTGSVSLFNTNFPAGTESANSSTNSVLFDAGVQVHILIMAMTVEYSTRFGVSTYGAKLSFKL